MSAVNWNKIKIVTENDETHSYSREEYTVSATAEIADIDTTYLLQGSIVLDISTGKMSIWDGSAWVEQ